MLDGNNDIRIWMRFCVYGYGDVRIGWEVVFMGIVMLEFFVWFWLLESGVYCVFVVFGYYYGVIGFYCGVYVYFCIFFGV